MPSPLLKPEGCLSLPAAAALTQATCDRVSPPGPPNEDPDAPRWVHDSTTGKTHVLAAPNAVVSPVSNGDVVAAKKGPSAIRPPMAVPPRQQQHPRPF